jgi:deoxyribodipyrimidine photolyase
MLNENDIKLLASVFATKDDLQKLASKEDVAFIRSDLNALKQDLNNFKETTTANFSEIRKDISEIKGAAESTKEILQEFIVTNDTRMTKAIERIDKQEEWIKLIAGKLGLSLQ